MSVLALVITRVPMFIPLLGSVVAGVAMVFIIIYYFYNMDGKIFPANSLQSEEQQIVHNISLIRFFIIKRADNFCHRSFERI